MYTGPLVLRKIISKKSYEVFMALSVAVRILLEDNAEKRAAYLDYAKNLLSYFVHSSEKVFGEIFIVYNVHNLLHLHEDSKHFQCSLNEISAFQFENHLQEIKRLVSHGQNPLARVCKRLNEAKCIEIEGSRTVSGIEI